MRIEVRIILGDEEGSREGDELFVGDVGNGVIIYNGAAVGVICVLSSA